MTIRIAMWSGPRNISTAMMRSFEHRYDTEVVDEPFYAAYLIQTGADHPMREEVLAAHEADPSLVADFLSGPGHVGAPLFYQKHMTHHMLPDVPRSWMSQCRHAFLIRSPERVLASYVRKRAEVSLEDIGFTLQAELFDHVADWQGAPPPVIDADDVLADPGRKLETLCAALCIPFDPAMLHWPAGPRASDGAWAPAWYDAVQQSVTFAKPEPALPQLEPRLQAIAEEARPIYDRLAAYRI
jgi:hypothetical protein